MAIEPDKFTPIGPDFGLFLARRLAGATFLMEPEINSKGGEMTHPGTCIEEGCTKYRVKNKRCSRHNKAYLARQGDEPESSPPAAAAEAEKLQQPGTDPAGLAAGIAPPPAVEPAQSAAPTKSLLQLVAKPPTRQPARPGFFLDFTGEEELLSRANQHSDNLIRDCLALIRALVDGKLCATDDSMMLPGDPEAGHE